MLDPNEKMKINIGIVGCNTAATSIIDLLMHDPSTRISFIYDPEPNAPGITVAKTHKILILRDINDIKDQIVDVILNLTGSIDTGFEIQKVLPKEVELLGTKSARLISSIIDERRKRLEERERMAREREVFHSMGQHMEKIDNMKDAGFAIIDYAMALSATKGAVIALYDKEALEMVVIASSGLEGFEQNMRWRIDECVATGKITSMKMADPEVFDLSELDQLTGKHFTGAGVKTIITVPLYLNEKIHSIIYLCDFFERVVLRDDIDTLALFGVYSSLIMDKVKILEKMRHLIISDGLTGLANQRYFMEQIEKEFQRSTRYGHDLSLVIFEIDNFKSYISEYGHLEGNELLKHLSTLLNKSVRETDLSARFGLHKFCILLCEISKEGVFTFAQRLVERIASYPMPNAGITVSAGVASYPREAGTYMELISRAEGNLHKAKKWGRNRACG